MIDATKEEGMSDRLQVNLPGIEVVSCIFSSQFKDRMYKTLDSSIKCGRATYPCDEETQATREYQKFIEQMGELEKDFRGQLMVCHHPDRRGAHDDFCDSWGLAVLGAHDKCQEIRVQGYQENKIFSNHNKGMYTRINKYTARRRR